jgi:DNA-binding response OmpR family regulator
MPVTKEEFERGSKVTNEERAVLSFLSQHPHQAFSPSEILHAIYPQAGLNFLNDFVLNMNLNNTLIKLVRTGRVAKRMVDYVDHYMLR